MDEMRALLDSLMGSDRNAVESSHKSSKKTFRDPDICHPYLIDFCPHDLFPNTKSDLGPCPFVHSDSVKESFLADEDVEFYRRKYEVEFMDKLQKLIASVEGRIRKQNDRILGVNDPQKELEKSKKIDKLKSDISQLLEKAQKAGEQGNIGEAEGFTTEATNLRILMDQLQNSHNQIQLCAQEKSLRVCLICGAMQSVGDAISRFESHSQGKQHVGYQRIRDTLTALQAKHTKQQSEQPQSTESTKSSATAPNDVNKESHRSDPDLKNGGSIRRSISKDGYDHKSRSPVSRRYSYDRWNQRDGGDRYRHSRSSDYRRRHYDDYRRENQSRRYSKRSRSRSPGRRDTHYESKR